MHDFIAELGQTRRAVAGAELRGAPAHVVELRRQLRAPIADVWDACTVPGRVRHWFLPLDGDLRPGGRFQFEGNAGGTVIDCKPPHRLGVTWECGDLEPSLVTVELVPIGDDATEILLRHTVPDDDQWAQYGPGAVGVGWDLPVAVLAAFIVGVDLPAGEEIMADPRTTDLMRQSAVLWGTAHRTAGASPQTVRDAAARSSAFYAPQDQPTAH